MSKELLASRFTVFQRLLLVIFASFATLVFTNLTAEAACEPGPGQVAFYVDANYAGACVVKSAGDYPTSPAIGLPNDSISSVKVGQNAQAMICRDENYGGDCVTIASNAALLTGRQVGNDAVSSLKVQASGTASCLPGPNQASFFRDANFSGPCVTKGFGEYANAASIGLPNDSISSIIVGNGTQVLYCKDVNFLGDCIMTAANTAQLDGARVGGDRISSLKVQSLGTALCRPSADQVAFFENENFTGPCSIRAKGDYANAGAMGIRNDTLSSIAVGNNVQAIICKDNDYKTDCIQLAANVPSLTAFKQWNDQASSARVQARGTVDCKPGPNQAAFFLHNNFLAPCVILGIGSYPDAASMKIDNDAISSIRIGGGVHVCAFESASYSGPSEDIVSDTPALDATLNDKISSVTVRNSANSCVAATSTIKPAKPVVNVTLGRNPDDDTHDQLHISGTGFQHSKPVTFILDIKDSKTGNDVPVTRSTTADAFGYASAWYGSTAGVCETKNIQLVTAYGMDAVARSDDFKTQCGGNQL